jgi:hypothetical protein
VKNKKKQNKTKTNNKKQKKVVSWGNEDGINFVIAPKLASEIPILLMVNACKLQFN